MKERRIELLAPAGSYEGFEAALSAGADAVYVGGAAFGARAYAKNFQEEELLRAIDVAHIHGRKLYLTVNTLLKNRELKEQLYDYLAPYYEAGLDAVIVQDMGVFRFIKQNFPGLHLHASTQMTVTGPQGMRFLEEQGASRVVAARELSLEELTAMRRESAIEIEAFVHGALCYSFSGQCLMSSLFGGRSGNRGRCAQPCRLPYQVGFENRNRAEESKTDKSKAEKSKAGRSKEDRSKADKSKADKHSRSNEIPSIDAKHELCPLSLKDICTIDILPEILEAGVTSLKIEGRMKQPGYTAGVTGMYRKYLDLLFENGAERYRVDEADRRYLLELFNRGGSCTGYYQMQNGPSMMAFTNEKKTAGVSSEITKRKEKIYGNLILFPGSPVILEVTYQGCSVTASGGEVQFAKNQPMEEARIRQQMEKLGGTLYEWERLDIEMDDHIFVPVKVLNEVRREALALLEEEILRPTRRELKRNEGRVQAGADASGLETIRDERTMQLDADTSAAEQERSIRVAGQERNLRVMQQESRRPRISGTIEDCGMGKKTPPLYVSCEKKETAAVLCKAGGIQGMYLPYNAMEQCLEDGLINGLEMYLMLPHIMRGDAPQGFLTQAEKWMDRGMSGFLVRNLESYALLRRKGWADKCVLDHSLYTWNGEAAAFFHETGCLRNTVPLELNQGELRHRDNRGSELVIYGYLPLMISAQCVRKNLSGCTRAEDTVILRDRYDKTFPAVCCCNPWKMETTKDEGPCYNIIYNSIPYGMLKEKEQVQALGMSAMRLSFTMEGPKEALGVLKDFQDVYLRGMEPPKREFTKGHFKRGAE